MRRPHDRRPLESEVTPVLGFMVYCGSCYHDRTDYGELVEGHPGGRLAPRVNETEYRRFVKSLVDDGWRHFDTGRGGEMGWCCPDCAESMKAEGGVKFHRTPLFEKEETLMAKLVTAQGHAMRVKNLGWLLRNWQRVTQIRVIPGRAPHRDAVLIADLRVQVGSLWVRYETDFASLEVLHNFLSRRVFEGLPVCWLGEWFEITLDGLWTPSSKPKPEV